MDGSAVDQHNKRVHEEYIDIINKAWDRGPLQYNGEYYKVPFPTRRASAAGRPRVDAAVTARPARSTTRA